MTRIAALLLIAAASTAYAQTPSPTSIDVPAGMHLLMSAKGEGVQIYSCTGGQWTLKAPDAKLIGADGKQIGTHFAGPTWKLNDGGEVKGKAIAKQPSPDAESVPWLLVQAVPGSATGSLSSVTYIRRTDTHGGAAPKGPCTGSTISIPYTASYSFYAAK
jgi:hypothetical protein